DRSRDLDRVLGRQLGGIVTRPRGLLASDRCGVDGQYRLRWNRSLALRPHANVRTTPAAFCRLSVPSVRARSIMRSSPLSLHRLARYGGLAGAALLSISAYLGGALPLQPGVDLTTIWHGERWMLACLFWLTGTSMLVCAWWGLRAGVPSARWAA